MLARGEPRGAALWAWWAGLTAAGWTAAGFAFASLPPMRFDAVQYVFLPLSALGQWWLLRQHFARAILWLVATAAGSALAALGLVTLDVLPESLLGPRVSGVRAGISYLVDGLALGVAQWLVLRGTGLPGKTSGNVRGTARWIVGMVAPMLYFAFPLFMQGFTALPEVPQVEREDWVLGVTQQYSVYGLAIGAVTGGILAWLVDQPRADEEDVY